MNTKNLPGPLQTCLRLYPLPISLKAYVNLYNKLDKLYRQNRYFDCAYRAFALLHRHFVLKYTAILDDPAVLGDVMTLAFYLTSCADVEQAMERSRKCRERAQARREARRREAEALRAREAGKEQAAAREKCDVPRQPLPPEPGKIQLSKTRRRFLRRLRRDLARSHPAARGMALTG